MDYFSKKVKIYISLIVALGTFMAIYLMLAFPITLNVEVFIFIGLLIIAESLPIPMPNQGGITVGFAIILPTIIFFGPGTAVLGACLGSLLSVSNYGGKYHHMFNIPFYKTTFNSAMYCIATGIAALVYGWSGGEYYTFSLGEFFLPALISAFAYIMINGIILARLLAYLSNTDFMKIWISNFNWALPNFIAIATLSITIAAAYGYLGIEAVILLFGPLLLARYSFKLYIDMKNNYIETIQALSSAMEEKDPYTQGHAQRVSELAELVGQEMKLNSRDMEQLRYAAILHDIGKIGIPEDILNKPGRLSREEFESIKQHPIKGVKILQHIDFLKEATRIMQYHHEYFDGTGYPQGTAGVNIPVLSRIITVADAYDAMTTDRPYRKALSTQYAIQEIQEKAGTQFDPKIVQAFVKLHREGKVDS